MKTATMTCDCCGGKLPLWDVWETLRSSDNGLECTGSVDSRGRCRAFSADDWALNAMAEVIGSHGSRFSGNSVADEAQEWIDNGFSPEDADRWCDVGVWDAETAAYWRDANLTPREASKAAERLVAEEEAEWDAQDEAAAKASHDWKPVERDSQYTDGDPIYATCNGDINASVLVIAASN